MPSVIASTQPARTCPMIRRTTGTAASAGPWPGSTGRLRCNFGSAGGRMWGATSYPASPAGRLNSFNSAAPALAPAAAPVRTISYCELFVDYICIWRNVGHDHQGAQIVGRKGTRPVLGIMNKVAKATPNPARQSTTSAALPQYCRSSTCSA